MFPIGGPPHLDHVYIFPLERKESKHFRHEFIPDFRRLFGQRYLSCQVLW